jgi:hypothetical protein
MRGVRTKDNLVRSAAVSAAFVLLWAGLCGVAEAQASPASTVQSTAQSTQPTSATQGSGDQNANQKPDDSKSTDPKSGDSKSDDAAANTGDIPRIRVGINEVNVVFTVTDKRGKRVTGLKQEDFHIVDDSKPAVEIRSFHAETNLPLQVALLIDASNSVRDRFKFEQESAIEFLNQTVRKSYDNAMVVGFDATPEVTQDFTDNTEALAHGVR